MDFFVTKDFYGLVSKKLESEDLSEDELSTIERLCKKVDVVKKLYILYKLDLSKRASDSELEVEDYLLVLDVTVKLTKKYRDFKYLNTALKLN